MPITPQQLAAAGQERDHQIASFQWVAVSGAKRYPALSLLHAVPNGARLMGTGTATGRIEGGRMKAEGLRPGVPDVCLPVAARRGAAPGRYDEGWYHGLYVEMKKPGREREPLGGRSEEQERWHRALAAQGYAVVTAYGWCAAAHALADYLGGTLVMPADGDCFFYLYREDAPW